ncbi:signal peptidase I [Candidatus Erwinia haradaeae]|uniref:Signal peptidase I n=1 Tax=Candidatus Erwinia haradaeae TaxID=1922217 RepID=A0A451D985_9GAMM|nr:signal peptidase I [Candidatus Erwinia haradaeae]VFP82826.1 Signal peptidase I [Candidatus Erwinia haradaeae]
MAYTFTLFLIIATISSGVLWCISVLQRVRMQRLQNIDHYSTKIKRTKKNTLIGWIDNIASLFPVFFLVLLVRSFIYEPFQIPSGSMMPTLLIGDFILVKKYAYGIKNPITQNTWISTGRPKRGDVVVFKYPHDQSQDYIKRVIGLPGDVVTYNPCKKTLSVQPACIDQKNCQNLLAVTYSDASQHDKQVFIDSIDKDISNSFDAQIFKDPRIGDPYLVIRTETLGDVKHQILLMIGERYVSEDCNQQTIKQKTITWLVPENMYFMMGDNRDNSSDSRYWGFVPEHNLVGQAIAVWMSLDKKQGQWPTGWRLNHLGSIH